MIKTETIEVRGRQFLHTYSDSGYCIQRDGVEYDEAYDPIGSDRTYKETSRKIDPDPEDEYLTELIAEVRA